MPEVDIAQSLAAVGIGPGDTVMIHGDAGVAAQYRSTPADQRISRLIADILDHIGPEGTVVVPTFSYSFTKGEDFDPASTPSDVGLFSESFRLTPGVRRSHHPIFSVAAWGRHAATFADSRIDDCFGHGTAFDLLMDLDAKIACLGCDISRITFVHYVEQARGVSYRYMKTFHGRVLHGGGAQSLATTYYVREMSIRSECDLGGLKDAARAQGRLAVGAAGRLPLMAIGARDFFEVGSQLLAGNPHALIMERLA
jgi:aminoglycoside 3-N-acetyltransferase